MSLAMIEELTKELQGINTIKKVCVVVSPSSRSLPDPVRHNCSRGPRLLVGTRSKRTGKLSALSSIFLIVVESSRGIRTPSEGLRQVQ